MPGARPLRLRLRRQLQARCLREVHGKERRRAAAIASHRLVVAAAIGAEAASLSEGRSAVGRDVLAAGINTNQAGLHDPAIPLVVEAD